MIGLTGSAWWRWPLLELARLLVGLAAEDAEHHAERVERGHQRRDRARRRTGSSSRRRARPRRRGSRPWRSSPRSPGRRASASAATRNATNVNGIARRRPDMRSMFCLPAIAAITEPAAMNISALKKACVIRWNMPGAVGGDRDAHDHVADLADRRVGDDPLQVGDDERDRGREQQRERADRGRDVGGRRAPARTAGACARSGRRPRSPSWRRGSGRRPASGPPSRPASQVWSGICADLANAPTRISRQIATIAHSFCVNTSRRRARTRRREVERARCRAGAGSPRAPAPTSPITLMTNAFMPARGRGAAPVPEADQRVGGEADERPADDQDHEVAGQHQQQHREDEEVEVAEVARGSRGRTFM